MPGSEIFIWINIRTIHMSRSSKILVFYSFLLINHFFHIYELNTNGFKQEFSLAAFSLTFTLFLQLLFLFIVLLVGYDLFQNGHHAYGRVKWVSILFLSYGLLITIALVYREENIPGSYSGFFYVMICLPMLLQLLDHLKGEREMALQKRKRISG